MKAFTYIKKREFAFVEKAKPTIKDAKDAIVRVTMSSICTSDCISSMVQCLVLYLVLPWGMRWWVL